MKRGQVSQNLAERIQSPHLKQCLHDIGSDTGLSLNTVTFREIVFVCNVMRSHIRGKVRLCLLSCLYCCDPAKLAAFNSNAC